MGFWRIIDDLSEGTQFPKSWNRFFNWMYIFQLIVAIGSCYVNKTMWPSKSVNQSFAVLQIRSMLIIQAILFYWEITFTNMISKDFNIVENHVLFIIHTALLIYKTESISGITLLPYFFYSLIWTFGNGSSQIFYLLFVLECFLYIFQTLYAYKLPKTLHYAFPLLAIYQAFSNYKLYCWSYDGTFCPSEKIIYIFGVTSFSFIISYLIIVGVIYSITVLPFFTILQKLEEDERNNMTIIDSIENSYNNRRISSNSRKNSINTNRNSFKDK